MGPLAGLKIIEVTGIGPGPFCGMFLADMGAELLAIDRPGSVPDAADPLSRSRRRIALDLKRPADVEVLLQLVARADALFEGFRPGVMERLGVGPDDCRARNVRLVYGRMTGWGQTGPLAHVVGHDINYIALSGALSTIGRSGDRPVPPLNLVGDFGGGGLLLAFGMMCAIFAARQSGQGQVVDAAIVDGAAAMMAMHLHMLTNGRATDAIGSSILSGSAPWYDVYETADGKYVSVGALEPKFYAFLIEKAGVDKAVFEPFGLYAARGLERAEWPRLKAILADVFRTRTRAQWCMLMEGTDACFAPVLSLDEAPNHPHNAARGTYIKVDGHVQNAPAPRFERTPAPAPRAAQTVHVDPFVVLDEWSARGNARPSRVPSA